MNYRMKFNKVGIFGCLLCFAGLFWSDYVFAGVISNWWYVINAIFWTSFLILKRKNRFKKIALFEFLAFVVMVLAYTISLPIYSYETAIRIVQSEQASVSHIKAEAPWKYRGFTDGNVYLVVFKAEEAEAFWFDPYSGNYGPYDIESRLPFLFGKDQK